MTGQYQKEMFDYLANTENYATAKEVARLIPNFEIFLQQDFWERLEKHLENLVKQDLDFHLDVKNEWGYWILLDEKRYIGVHLSRGENNRGPDLWLGICGKSICDSKKIEHIEAEYQKLLKSQDQYWLTYEVYPDKIARIKRFRQDGDFTDILLEELREVMAKEIAENIWQYTLDTKKMCTELLS